MDLLTLAAKIELDDSSYTKGVSNAEKVGQQLQGKLSAMTVAVGNLTADMIRKAASGVKQIIGGAVDAYADYQQLVGGVETLFKNSATKVQNYAKQSFKTTGLSANQYMETVTSFSAALIQGLEGNTEKAADLANMAVTDMADNANKMGTDISMIQSAYQGFAKANFTMLDNLKLGYGGTRGEMVRLINDSGILESEIKDLDDITFDQLVQAIHVIQEQLGITGTTAAEARDTISGSKASLKAAWEDMLSAIGGEGDESRLNQTLENFKESFSTYMENYIPTLATTITNSGTLVEAVAESIASLPTNLLAELGENGLEAGTEMVSGASKITTWLIDSLTNVFKSVSADPSKARDFAAAVGDFVGTAMKDIALNAPTIFTGMIDAGVALAGGLVEGLFQGLFGQEAEVDKITDQLQKDITDVDVNSAKASALVKYIDGLTQKYGDSVTKTEEFKMAAAELEAVLPGAGDVFRQYGEDITGATTALNGLIDSMRKTAIMAGMTKALNEQYELLGQQQTTKAQAQYTAEIYGAQAKGLSEILETSAKAYAEAFINKYQGREEDGTIAMWLNDARLFLQDINEGRLTPEEMWAQADTYAGYLKGEGENPWDKSQTDKIVNPEELDSIASRVAEFQAGVEDAMKAAADAQREIDATQQQIAITEAAVNAAMEESFTGAANEVTTGGQAVAGALEGAAGAISSVQIPTSIGGGDGESGTGEATGMDYVPYDGFRAELHRGEAVLTRSENNARRRGYDAIETAAIMEDALIAALKKVSVNMDGRDVGNITTKPVSKNINASKRSKQRGMGA